MDSLSLLVPAFGNVAWTIIAFIVALSIIVAIHEYGHYIVGRWSGIHAEVFSVGFGPVIWSRRDRRGTLWQIAALPLGGYVKFAGDADAASGKDEAAMQAAQDDPAALRRTMHGAPVWARAATVAAGPVFNFVFSIALFCGLFLFQGETKYPLTISTLHTLPNAVGEVRVGDTILEIEGQPIPDGGAEARRDYFESLPRKPLLEYLVERDGSERTVQGPTPFPPVALSVLPRSAAMSAGFQSGDVIVSIDGQPIFEFDQLKTAVEGSGGAALDLQVWRAGQMLDMTLKPRRSDEPRDEGGFQTHWRIGIAGGTAFEFETAPMSLGTAISQSFSRFWEIISGSLNGLWHVVSGAISSCNLNGPVGIAQISSAAASDGALSFIGFVALLSTAVGLLNLFPIPVLDGGHLVFHAYEAVTGRPPSDKIHHALMLFGLTIVLGFMVFALGNDLICPFFR